MKRTDETSTIGDQVAALLQQISDLYDDDVVLTLISRSLNSPDGTRDTLVSNDPERDDLPAVLTRLLLVGQTDAIEKAVKRELQ